MNKPLWEYKAGETAVCTACGETFDVWLDNQGHVLAGTVHGGPPAAGTSG